MRYHDFLHEALSAGSPLVAVVVWSNSSILKGFEKGETSIAVFLDISKAFDKVWHRGLLVKLYNNGLRGNLLRWF
jgi:hypothetical protein